MKSKTSENLTTTIATESENLTESLRKLKKMLDVVTDYVNNVVVCIKSSFFKKNSIFLIFVIFQRRAKQKETRKLEES